MNTPIQATVINAEGVTMRRRRLSINAYELRVYRTSPYVRRRLSGHNPHTLFRRTSGSGAPKWMLTLAKEITAAKCLTTEELNDKFNLKVTTNHELW